MTLKKGIKRIFDSIIEHPRVLYREGMEAGFMQDYEEAIEKFDRVNYISIGSNFFKTQAAFYKAVALDELEKHQEAVEVYEKYLENNDEDASAWTNLGVAYSNLEKYEDALKCFGNALANEKDDAIMWANKAEVLVDLERPEEALEFCNKALELRNDDVLALVTKSEALVDLDKFDESISICKKLIQVDPENFYVWNLLGIAYMEFTDEYQEALSCFEKGLKLEPAEEILWYNKACVLSLMNKQNDALDALFVSISIEPENLTTISDESDFNNIKNSERFKKFLTIEV